EVFNRTVKEYSSTAFKENITNYFHRQKKENQFKKIVSESPIDAQKLTGIGSSASFSIEFISDSENLYQIKRYNDYNEIDYVGWFKTDDHFDIQKEYKFTYDSNCEYCHLIQNNNKIKFSRFKTCPKFVQLQKAYSA
ncbi:MAG: hypothetical protein ACI93N_001587, partial [Flavobacteriaceae bacterium]